ncbi:hypothetical protein D3C71_250010 [compost metagenome]
MNTFKIDGADVSAREQYELIGMEAYETTPVAVMAKEYAAELNFEVVLGDSTTMTPMISAGDRGNTSHPNNLRHPAKILAYCVRSELAPGEDGEPQLGPFSCSLYKMDGLNRAPWRDPFFDDTDTEQHLCRIWEEEVGNILRRNPDMLSDAWKVVLSYKAAGLDETIREQEESLRSLIEFRNSLEATPFKRESIYRHPLDDLENASTLN